jgi:hypothetical protein
MQEHWRRIAFYLVINILVSALTVWIVFSIMLRRNVIPASQIVDQANAASVQNGGEDGESFIPLGQFEINSVTGAGDVEIERVLIRHVGTEEVSLEGWKLEDDQGNTFEFPALTMFSGGAVTVYTRSGNNTVVDLFWGLDTPVFSEGEQVLLLDPDGNVQARYTVP